MTNSASRSAKTSADPAGGYSPRYDLYPLTDFPHGTCEAAVLLTTDELGRSAAAENFRVAPRLLSTRLRHDVRAVYDVARTIDEIGDAPGRPPQQRLLDLDDFDADLARIWSGPSAPQRPVLRRLAETVRRRDLPAGPFHRLVEANRIDQRRTTYADWSELRSYCSFSADPIGRIVLDLFDATTEQRVSWSDDVCTALQLLEHCQDVAEDRRAGRVYLPLDTLTHYGAELADLDRAETSKPLRRAVACEVARAEELLGRSGPPLVSSLRGSARWAVAGFTGGGLATADALRRDGFDVLRLTPRPRKRDAVRHALSLAVASAAMMAPPSAPSARAT